MSAEEARDKGIRIFVVAASTNIEETGLKEIANSPASLFRDKYMAVDLSQNRPILHTETMDRIIKTMVAHSHTHSVRKCRSWSACSCFASFVFTETSGLYGGEAGLLSEI